MKKEDITKIKVGGEVEGMRLSPSPHFAEGKITKVITEEYNPVYIEGKFASMFTIAEVVKDGKIDVDQVVNIVIRGQNPALLAFIKNAGKSSLEDILFAPLLKIYKETLNKDVINKEDFATIDGLIDQIIDKLKKELK